MEARNMKERNTDPTREEFFATLEKPFHFVDSGLDNVYLVGIRYFVDDQGNTSAEIPALEQLMQLIARDIVTARRDLTGKEIKFLRKRLGKKATEYCTILALEPETLSRIENGKQAVSQQSQKLARLSYCLFSEDHNLIDCAKSVLQEIIDEYTAKRKQKIVLEMDDNQEWRELKAA